MERASSSVADPGLMLTVPGRREPGLRFEVASGGRMLLRRRDDVVFFGLVHRWRYGVALYRTGSYTSPLPPIPAELVRRSAGSPGWFDQWAHRFAGWLDAAGDGPLHDGAWVLRRRKDTHILTYDLVADFPYAHLDWFAGWHGIVPLRPLPGPESGRVKAYRKQARDGVLPPLLLGAASALDGYLLLDGHARLAAALAENVEPGLLVLEPSDPDGGWPIPRSRAWPIRGGVEAWEDAFRIRGGDRSRCHELLER